MQVIKHLKDKDIKEQEFSEQTLKHINSKFNTSLTKRSKIIFIFHIVKI